MATLRFREKEHNWIASFFLLGQLFFNLAYSHVAIEMPGMWERTRVLGLHALNNCIFLFYYSSLYLVHISNIKRAPREKNRKHVEPDYIELRNG
jgi:hypothetical protein